MRSTQAVLQGLPEADSSFPAGEGGMYKCQDSARKTDWACPWEEREKMFLRGKEGRAFQVNGPACAKAEKQGSLH